MKIQWPNRITILRILLVVPFIVILSLSIISKGSYSYINLNSKTILFIAAGCLFSVAMMTDWIDGFWARKLKYFSKFGKIFDPLADKIIITSALVILAVDKIVFFYLTIIFIVRDFIVDGLRIFAATEKNKVNVGFLGKLKTLTMSVSIFIIFSIYPLSFFENNKNIWLINVPLICAAILSIASGWQYLKIVWPVLFKIK